MKNMDDRRVAGKSRTSLILGVLALGLPPAIYYGFYHAMSAQHYDAGYWLLLMPFAALVGVAVGLIVGVTAVLKGRHGLKRGTGSVKATAMAGRFLGILSIVLWLSLVALNVINITGALEFHYHTVELSYAGYESAIAREMPELRQMLVDTRGVVSAMQSEVHAYVAGDPAAVAGYPQRFESRYMPQLRSLDARAAAILAHAPVKPEPIEEVRDSGRPLSYSGLDGKLEPMAGTYPIGNKARYAKLAMLDASSTSQLWKSAGRMSDQQRTGDSVRGIDRAVESLDEQIKLVDSYKPLGTP